MNKTSLYDVIFDSLKKEDEELSELCSKGTFYTSKFYKEEKDEDEIFIIPSNGTD